MHSFIHHLPFHPFISSTILSAALNFHLTRYNINPRAIALLIRAPTTASTSIKASVPYFGKACWYVICDHSHVSYFARYINNIALVCPPHTGLSSGTRVYLGAAPQGGSRRSFADLNTICRAASVCTALTGRVQQPLQQQPQK